MHCMDCMSRQKSNVINWITTVLPSQPKQYVIFPSKRLMQNEKWKISKNLFKLHPMLHILQLTIHILDHHHSMRRKQRVYSTWSSQLFSEMGMHYLGNRKTCFFPQVKWLLHLEVEKPQFKFSLHNKCLNFDQLLVRRRTCQFVNVRQGKLMKSRE